MGENRDISIDLNHRINKTESLGPKLQQPNYKNVLVKEESWESYEGNW